VNSPRHASDGFANGHRDELTAATRSFDARDLDLSLRSQAPPANACINHSGARGMSGRFGNYADWRLPAQRAIATKGSSAHSYTHRASKCRDRQMSNVSSPPWAVTTCKQTRTLRLFVKSLTSMKDCCPGERWPGIRAAGALAKRVRRIKEAFTSSKASCCLAGFHLRRTHADILHSRAPIVSTLERPR